MNIAVIPARGGSKRIPNKNIRPFCGKPIIAYSIELAVQSGLFDRIIVSTDSDKVAGVAVQHGAEVPFKRPETLADDYTGTGAVVTHALQWCREEGLAVDFACCIYATAPLLQLRFLREGWERLRSSAQAYAFAVTAYEFPIQRSLRLEGDGVAPMFPEHTETRSQDLEPVYHDAAQFYWGRAEAYLKSIPMYSPRSSPIVIPKHLVQDIDREEDWIRAELMYRVSQERIGQSCE